MTRLSCEKKVNLALLFPPTLEFIIVVYELDVHNLKNPI
ncbi:hypothetical protein NC652_014168 [Populus alba x Populus x berolinensis]|nr:hypothetical protein NC652_014164 [Populus alba x Populus x berolinensis]KAJ6930554.1 hypothetical protein NC652_014168 [Populus alba x Populus x berolinensis]